MDKKTANRCLKIIFEVRLNPVREFNKLTYIEEALKQEMEMNRKRGQACIKARERRTREREFK